jgi:hypothetical protein
MADSLTSMAETAVSSGYQPGNAWEAMLDRHMREHLPNTVQQLGKDYPAYLTVQTKSAQDMLVSLVSSGTDPRQAKSLAIQELLPLAESDLADQQAMLRNENPDPLSSTEKATGDTPT